MRDIVLATFIFGSIPFIMRTPFIGVLMYVWLSVMNPHRLTWGFSYDFNFALVIAVVTLLSTLFSKERTWPKPDALGIALLLFIAWTGVTTMFAFYPQPSFERWTALMKTQLIVVLILMLVHSKEQLRQLIWVIVLSIAYYGVKGGIWILGTGGDQRVWGPPGSYIEDNNSLAIAVVMIIPLMRYLQLTSPHKWVRWGLLIMMLACGVGVLGTYSRGALLAVSAMILFLGWKSRQRLPLFMIAIVAIPLALAFMPERWYARMDTIAEYQQDSSAQMRLNTWATMLNIAKDRPIVGGGFEIAQRDIYLRYSPDASFPPQVAHSIYFEALGEHGFVGLALFLLLYFTFWRQAGALVRDSTRIPDGAWGRDFGLMIQVMLIGFAVGGAFLSLVNFDVPYYLMGAMIVARSIMKRGAPALAMTTASASLGQVRTNQSPRPGSSRA